MGREEKAKEEQKVGGGKSMEGESGDERRKRGRGREERGKLTGARGSVRPGSSRESPRQRKCNAEDRS